MDVISKAHLKETKKELIDLDLNKSINGKDGYSINLKLSKSDLDLFQKMIRIQWLYRLQLLIPNQLYKFDELGIECYHELSHLIDHSKAWPKYSRVFPKEALPLIKNMDFFKKLETAFGKIKIADEEKLGWENVYWRLVRPGNADLGSIHSDRWFVELGYYGEEIKDPSYERIKIWVAIHTELGKNGLLVIPASHQKLNWRWHSEERYGQKKPFIDENIADLNVVLLPTEAGRTVVFHYDLLHGGAPNLAETTRVSVEFTFLVRK